MRARSCCPTFKTSRLQKVIHPIERKGSRLSRRSMSGVVIEVADVLPRAQDIIHCARRIDVVPAFLLVILVSSNQEEGLGRDERDQLVLIGACRRSQNFVA